MRFRWQYRRDFASILDGMFMILRAPAHLAPRSRWIGGFFILLIAAIALWLAWTSPLGRPHRHPPTPTGEPSLPKVLDLVEESSGQLRITVIPAIEGRARLDVRSDHAFQWIESAPQGPMTLGKADVPRVMRLSVKRKNAKERAKVTARLVFEDDSGNPALSVQEELILGTESPAAPSGGTPPSVTVHGVAADGVPIEARVPNTAPTPRTVEGRP